MSDAPFSSRCSAARAEAVNRVKLLSDGTRLGFGSHFSLSALCKQSFRYHSSIPILDIHHIFHLLRVNLLSASSLSVPKASFLSAALSSGNKMEPLEEIFNHMVLPVKVPDHGDRDSEAVGSAVLARLMRACKVVDQDSSYEWSAVKRCLGACKGIARARFEAQELVQDWTYLGPGDFSLVRISEQNAALLVRRVVQ